ncbi:ATP-binding cassette domain-containing protein [Acetobacterium paludosum]|uniref:ATP-binding cassette domain-containing protein n=1 Tax=Acetobacterium paludosum TaxID=52693 RepID=A0A923HQR0_9FIRM|nr:ABC transporter ATP-binding protein [Acetobacterium paludosum]MBC3886988.1 ATP-binding cassette domain-containing protein [Acetobacterium paludosum]
MMNAIEIKNLNKSYHDFNLKNVSFNVPKGSIVGFIGENGAGKTTTLKAILNLINRDNGTIEILGMNNTSEDKKIKEDIGVVLDGCNFHDSLKTGDISKMMASIYKNWNLSVFQRYLKKFELPENKTVKEYSRGMKMKLQIAVALSHDPKVLILDEATSGLDPIVREEMLDVFMEFIQDEEHAILISSHITSDLDKIADYIVFIHQGEILLNEEKETLLEGMGILKCSEDDFRKLDKEEYIRYRKNQFGFEVLIKDKLALKRKYKEAIVDGVTIEEIMLFYVRGER